MSRFPMTSTPNGWFPVLWADALRPGQVLPVQAFGEELVAMRTEGGAVSVLDAHCPHLGAHLGHGGVIRDGQLVCPFHGWRFHGDGRCAGFPEPGKTPKHSDLRSWEVQERFGRLFVWHHADGGAPAWPLPAQLDGHDQRWSEGARLSWDLRSHPQDVLENSADVLHFKYIHEMKTVELEDTLFEDRTYTARMRAEAGWERILGASVSAVVHITAQVHGMGFQTIRTQVSTRGGRMLLDTRVVEGLVPVSEGQLRMELLVQVRRLPVPGLTALAQARFAQAVFDDVTRDAQIWENKRFLDRPRLTGADGPIGPFRAWARRFYDQAAA